MEVVHANLKESIVTMSRVIFALMLRETKTRYGRLQIGYLWAFLEPILLISVLGLVFTYFRMRDSSTMPLIQFLTTGFIPFMLFRDIVTQNMTAIRSNQQLLYFPQVQVFDIGIARTMLEFSTFLIVFTILSIAIAFSGIEVVTVEDPLRMILASTLIVIYGYGIGAAIGSMIPLFPSLQLIVQSAFMRPMFFLSGVFFTLEMIPDEIKPYAALNPMLQLIELFRSAYFQGYESTYIDYPYLLSVIFLTLFFGLLIQRALRRHAFKI
jgi:capsular polysaccharide transport system permease protein